MLAGISILDYRLLVVYLSAAGDSWNVLAEYFPPVISLAVTS